MGRRWADGQRQPPRALAAPGESPAAFDRRCIPPRGVAPRSNMPTILPRRALPRGRLTGLGATRDFYHGLLAAREGNRGSCVIVPGIASECRSCVSICDLPTAGVRGTATTSTSTPTCAFALNHDLTLQCRNRWILVVVIPACAGPVEHAGHAAGSRGQQTRLIEWWAVGVEQVLVGLDLTGLRAVVDDLDALAGRETYLGWIHASIRDGKHRRRDVSPVATSSIAPSAIAPEVDPLNWTADQRR